MGTAKTDFDRKKDAEVSVYEVASTVIAQLENMTKEQQRKVIKLVDEQLKITPPSPVYSFLDR